MTLAERFQQFLLFLALLLGCELSVVAQAKLDLNKPTDALKVSQKFQCSLTDGKPAIYWWKGAVYSRVPGERDRHLFNVEGMNIRACKSITDPQKGYGYRLVSRELLLYSDPETNQLLRTWQNPFTGKTVEVVHVANDPVNQPPSFAVGRDGKPYQFQGTFKRGRVIMSLEVPLFYKNPLGGEYQDYVGGTYHAMEMFNFFAYEKELLDATNDTANDITVTWSRIADWLPWMEMGDKVGTMIFSCVGRRVASLDALSETMRNEIKTTYQAYTAPPPVDDTRPNETSWTYFKKRMEAKQKAK